MTHPTEKPRQRGTGRLLCPLRVEEHDLPFLVDTEATYSTIQNPPENNSLSDTRISVVGFSGVPMTLPVTAPLKTELGLQSLTHPYIVSSQVPVNLMGGICSLSLELQSCVEQMD